MSKICRLCIGECADFIEMFGKVGLELGIISKISQHFWFEPTEEDFYSKMICTKCWMRLRDFDEFYKDVKIAQDTKLAKTTISPIDKNHDISFDIKEEDFLIKNEVLLSENYDSVNSSAKSLATLAVKIAADSPLYSPANSPVNSPAVKEQDDSDDSIIDEPPNKYATRSSGRIVKHVARKTKRGRPKGSKNTKRTDEIYEKIKENAEKRVEDKIKREEEDQRIRDFFKMDCELCSAKLSTFFEINVHYRQVHSLKRGHVTCCKKKLIRRCALLEHLDWHLNPDEFRCTICGKVYSDRYCLKLHMAHHAPEEMRIFKCDICGKGYPTKGKLSHHLSITHVSAEKKLHKCNVCGKAFPLYSILTSHIRRVHEFAYTSVCDICAKVFKSKNQCDIHRREQHSGENRQKVECTLCGAWLKNTISLYCHMRRSHRRTPQSCEICGKVAPNKEALRNHKRYVHELKRLHKCSFCDKAFKQLVSLKEHQASHTGDILYICPYCPKTFNSNANMHSHRKNKHPEEWLRDRNNRKGPIKFEQSPSGRLV